MAFAQMLKILREQNKGKIVFINAGAFYIAIEEDAVLLIIAYITNSPPNLVGVGHFLSPSIRKKSATPQVWLL